jgi:flagellar protein FliL
MSDDKAATPKKKGGMMKLIVLGLVAVIVIGGGTVGGLWAMGMLGGHAAAAEDHGPKLVPKSEQKRAAGGEGGEKGATAAGNKPPSGVGGDQYASNYYTLDKDFTSNLQGSVHYVQVGLAVSTPYDDSVIENIKTNEIAVRSAILMALGDTPEDQVTTADGKRQLQVRLVKAINDTLKQKEGFGGVSNVYFTNFVVQ